MEVLELKTVVTSLKFYDTFLFAGCGGYLLAYKDDDRSWMNVLSLEIFIGQNIHGIIINDLSRILVFGYRRFAGLSFSENLSKMKKLCELSSEDWIMDAQWLSNDEICILTAHSKLLLYSLNSEKPIKSIVCSNRCITYCGTIVNKNWNDLILLGGTVYNYIIVWASPGIVLHELKGHKGVIFNVTCNADLGLIISTSDDRSASVWQIQWKDSADNNAFINESSSSENNSFCTRGIDSWRQASFSHKLTVWGHTARVWASDIIDNEHFATVGEDGMVIVWSRKDGQACWSSGNNCGGATAISCSSDRLAVGGTDSSIVIHYWSSSNSLLTPAPFPPISEAAKRVMLSPKGEVIVCCEGGHVFLWKNSWTPAYSSDDLSSYCISSPSPSRRYFALASISGMVHLLKYEGETVSVQIYKKLIEGRIFSLLWLKEDRFLICGVNGQMSIWKISFNPNDLSCDLIMCEQLLLPESKERWPTCAAINENTLLVGDRHGSIILYDLKSSSKECCEIVRGVHKGRGASCVLWNGPNKAISCGRDGTLRKYRYSDTLTLESTIRLRVDWPADIINTDHMGPLLLSFHHVYAEVIALNDMRTLLRVKCGGGHRSWDWLLSPSDCSISIAFISNKSVYIASSALEPPSYLRNSYHGRTINCCCVVSTVIQKMLIVTGGEDCSLKIMSSLSPSGECCASGWHLSSIRSVTSCCLGASSFLFSAGGRQQIKAWSLLEDGSLSELACSRSERKSRNTDPEDMGETRYMGICAVESGTSFVTLYTASSDGSIKVYLFSTGKGSIHASIEFSSNIEVESCMLCITKCDEFVFAGGTSGNLNIFSPKMELLEKIPLHCGGLNTISVCKFNGLMVVASGGDDTTVTLSVTNENGKFMSSSVLKHHTAQVTGVIILKEGWLFSVGGDQVLVTWRWTVKDNIEFTYCNSRRTTIADPHGLSVGSCKEEDSVMLVIFGIGIEVIKINLNNFNH